MAKIRSDGEIVEAVKVKYEECNCCGDTWYYCPKCLSKNHIDSIGVQACKNCGIILEVVMDK
jgi:Pyruvate/2-oxoacid:ferredoxin oxidoreductase delta subunit